MSYLDSALNDTESQWDEIKGIPNEINSKLAGESYNMSLVLDKADAWVLPEFIKHDPTYDPENPTLYQRTIFFHLHRLGIDLYNYALSVKHYFCAVVGTNSYVLAKELSEARDGVNYIEEAEKLAEEFEDGASDLEHAFHAIPNESEVEDSIIENGNYYSEEAVSESYGEGFSDAKGKALEFISEMREEMDEAAEMVEALFNDPNNFDNITGLAKYVDSCYPNEQARRDMATLRVHTGTVGWSEALSNVPESVRSDIATVMYEVIASAAYKIDKLGDREIDW